MPKYFFTQFTPDSDDMNVPGSSDLTKPSEGWKGRDVNDALRATNSAVRNLGDAAAKLPVDGSGNVNLGPRNGQIGTAAFQDVGSFDNVVLGPNVRGSVGGGVLLMLFCSPAQVAAVYAEQRTRGFDLCDGRNTTDPYPPFTRIITMPNLLGCFPWFTDSQLNVGAFMFGAIGGLGPGVAQPVTASDRTVAVGTHNHGATSGEVLGYASLPSVVTSVATVPGDGGIAQGNDRILQVVTQGSSGPHAHSTFEGGAHSHGFNVRPPSIAVLPFLRVW